MASTIDFNQSPYFDDFENNAKDKNFHRVLFKPGVAVQARELTQLQTILQNQIERFGFNVFKEGSEVTGAGIFLDNTFLLRFQSSYGGTTVDISTFEGQYARSRDTEHLYYIKKAVPADGIENNILHVQHVKRAYNASNSSIYIAKVVANTFTLAAPKPGEIFDFSANGSLTGSYVFSGSNTGAAQLITSTTGARPYFANGNLFHIDEGIFFTNGNFVKNSKQSIVISSNTDITTSIGFNVTESVVNSDNDNTLLDNARGSYNFTAPGADRYKISLDLSSKIISDVSSPNLTTSNYIEVARVKNGEIVRKIQAPNYNTLGDVLAERTYDESGNYIVRGLNVNLSDNSANAQTLTVEVSPGRAYVKGYQVNNRTTQKLRLTKARDTDSVTEKTMTGFYGNFVFVNSLSDGAFDIQGQKVELHANTTPADAPGLSTKIGDAYVKNIEYSSGTGVNRIYKLFLYDVNISEQDRSFDLTRSIIAGNASSFTAKALVDNSSITTFTKFGTTTAGANTIIISNPTGIKKGQKVSDTVPHFPDPTIVTNISNDTITVNQNANVSNTSAQLDFTSTVLSDSEYKTSVFPLPNKFVRNVTGVDYKFKRTFGVVQFTAGVATIQTDGASERFSSGTGSLANENFFVLVKSGGTGTVTNGLNVDMTTGGRSIVTAAPSGSPGTATIDVNEAGFNGTCDIIAAIDVTGDSRRVKTFANNQTKTFDPILANTIYSLGYSDVIKINAIYEGNATDVTTNDTAVTNKFIFNAGQRDTFYDHATIKLKSGEVDTTGKILVDYNRYDHGGGRGYFVADSYPSYDLIPSFINTKGEEINLRDHIDFRPIRTANASSNVYSTTNKLFDQSQIVDSQTFEIEMDYDYYLPKTAKLIVDKEGLFKLNVGASKLINPPVPSDDSDGMTLAEFRLKPYTLSADEVKKKIERNVRYTMKDIGNLEKRIERIEEITSLNLLENQINSSTFIDENGTILFKSGFLVDAFNGHGVGDIASPDYKVSVDRRRGILHPSFTSDSVPLVESSSTLQRTGDYFTLPFTETPFLNQSIASRAVNVNPFHVSTFIGTLKLTPDTDVWVDFTSKPVVVNNPNGNLDHFAFISNKNSGTEWGEWEISSPDVSITDFGETSNEKISLVTVPRFTGTSDVDREILENTNNALNDQFYYFMRSKKVGFTATGLRPNTRMYIYIDGIGISKYSAPSSFSATSIEDLKATTVNPTSLEIFTDDNGKAEGFFFIPNDANFTRAANTGDVLVTYENSAGSDFKLSNTIGANTLPLKVGGINILAGTKPVVISDNPLTPLASSTYAISYFTSEGRRKYKEPTTNGRPNNPPSDGRGGNDDVGNQGGGSTPGGHTPSPNPDSVIFDGGVGQPSSTREDKPYGDSDKTREESIAEALNTTKQYVEDNGLGDISDLTTEDVLPTGGTGNVLFHDPGDGSGPIDVSVSLVNAADEFAGGAFSTDGKPNQDAVEWTDATIGKYVAEGLPLGEAVKATLSEAINTGALEKGTTLDAAGFTISTDEIIDTGERSKCLAGKDPLAQSFFISEDFNPKGIFVTSVDLFFDSKDENLPVTIEIRPTVNGFPSSDDVITLSRVTKNPSEINLPTAPNTPVATNFAFDAPLHLLPGEYALIVMTDSLNYFTYISRIGDKRLGSDEFINSQPTLGTLFKSQNARTWTPSQEEDLCFTINKAQFTTSTNFNAVLQANNVGRSSYSASGNTVGQFDVSVLNLTEFSSDPQFVTTYELQTRPESGSLDSYTTITPNQTIFFETEKKITDNADYKLRVTYRSSNPDISPYFDASVASGTLIKNLINGTSAITSNPETQPNSGGALARYITRKVTLAEGFNATTLKVLMSQNMPRGSTVQVYYKVLNENDNTSFEERPYVEMTRVETDVVTNDELYEYNNYEYIAEGITYAEGSTTFNDFNQFVIKIVMFADNSALSPSVRNLRAIAFA